MDFVNCWAGESGGVLGVENVVVAGTPVDNIKIKLAYTNVKVYSNKIRKYEFRLINSSHDILLRSFVARIALLGPSGPFHTCRIAPVASTGCICISCISRIFFLIFP